MSKILLAINSYKTVENINIGAVEYLERILSMSIKEKIEKSNLHLHILAILFKQAIEEAREDSEVEKILCEKMQDPDLIIRLGSKFNDVNL